MAILLRELVKQFRRSIRAAIADENNFPTRARLVEKTPDFKPRLCQRGAGVVRGKNQAEPDFALPALSSARVHGSSRGCDTVQASPPLPLRMACLAGGSNRHRKYLILITKSSHAPLTGSFTREGANGTI